MKAASLPLILAALGAAGASRAVAAAEPRYVPHAAYVPCKGRGIPPRDAVELKRVMLRDHNAARAEAGVDALEWDDLLAAAALGYARDMADQRMFAHSPPATRRGQGENLWTARRGACRYEEMRGWTEERRDFQRGRFPNVAARGEWQKVGHYTQIIWRSTRRVGCALADNGRDEYLVCRYSPPANVWGRDPLE